LGIKLLVETPQPKHNAIQTQKQKSNRLQKILEDEVVGRDSLLLLI
jgi:hypothetical protein